MRTKKTGTALELFAMEAISKILEALPPETQERVANWVSSKPWGQQAPVQSATATLS